MANPLEIRKLKVLKRLESTINSTNSIIYEINQDLVRTLNENEELERVADIYNLWISKV